MIKEPNGVDFIVAPTKLTKEDKKAFKEAIAKFKKNKSKK